MPSILNPHEAKPNGNKACLTVKSLHSSYHNVAMAITKRLLGYYKSSHETHFTQSHKRHGIT